MFHVKVARNLSHPPAVTRRFLAYIRVCGSGPGVFRRCCMVPKGTFLALAALVCAAFLAGNSSMADEYRADEFLRMDLSKAALSPKPLGPPAQFEPVPVEG